MKIFKGETFADVYKSSLESLLKDAEFETSPRGMAIRENTNTTLIIEDPTSCLYHNGRRSSQLTYIAAEILWYFSGRNDLKFIEKYAAFWRQIANEDGSLNSAYGNLIFSTKNEHGYSQWEWAIQSLINDKDTRQALMTFNRPSYQYEGNKDFICTLNGIFNIRDNKLNLTINMRSNDAILGTPTDIAFFCLLQQQALNLLKSTYPDLELGTYTHIANSYHIYERHFELVRDMLKYEFLPKQFPSISQNFIGLNGQPAKELNRLMFTVEIDSPYTTSDPLFNWIKQMLPISLEYDV
jgi:thymidylate synthase